MPNVEMRNDTAEQLETLVDRWFYECFHGSLVARSTDVWNHVQGAKDDLKRRIASFIADARIR